MSSFTYADAGVDLSKVKNIHSLLANKLSETFKFREGKFGNVLFEIGHYAGLVDIGNGRVLALHVDGVGTKVLIAQLMEKFDTIGIDCVAMCVNDLICMGAEPFALIDYIALERADDKLVYELTLGLIKGAEKASIAIVGGETAIMPDVIKGVNGKGFDLAAMCCGIVEKDKVITGKEFKEGDVVLGVKSSGIHSNGLSLARKVLLSKYKVSDYINELGRSLGEELLEPTYIYVKPTLKALKECEIHGLAHITGGAFSKLQRLIKNSKLGFNLDNIPKPPAIFSLIQKEGKISDREMFRTFNMGIGFCICAPIKEIDSISSIYEHEGFSIEKIGKVERINGVFVKGIRVDD
ncbi:MAG: phosphoribosylformylglycinamidine cyclo-ligase [Nitrososphaerales archaeon]